MNIGNSVYLDSDICVGDKVGRGDNCRVDITVDDEVWSFDREPVKYYFVDEGGYGDGICVNKVLKVVKGRIIVGVGEIIGWVVDSVVGYGLDISAGITFGFDDEYNMGYSDGSFDVSNYCKPVD